MRKRYAVTDGKPSPEGVPLKRCNTCGDEFPVADEYFKQKKRSDGSSAGRSPTCRRCEVRGKARYILSQRQ